jgi:hypothetical protein
MNRRLRVTPAQRADPGERSQSGEWQDWLVDDHEARKKC